MRELLSSLIPHFDRRDIAAAGVSFLSWPLAAIDPKSLVTWIPILTGLLIAFPKVGEGLITFDKWFARRRRRRAAKAKLAGRVPTSPNP